MANISLCNSTVPLYKLLHHISVLGFYTRMTERRCPVILMVIYLTCLFEVKRNIVNIIQTKELKRLSVSLFLSRSRFHLIYSAGSHYWVGGFTTLPSLFFPPLIPCCQNLPFAVSHFSFLVPSVLSWVGVSTSCHLTGTSFISPLWQLFISFLLPCPIPVLSSFLNFLLSRFLLWLSAVVQSHH